MESAPRFEVGMSSRSRAWRGDDRAGCCCDEVECTWFDGSNRSVERFVHDVLALGRSAAPATLYHYGSLKTLQGCRQARPVCYHAAYLNDESELSHATEDLKALIRTRAEQCKIPRTDYALWSSKDGFQ